MIRRTIAYLLVVTHLANTGCSNLPVPLPGVVEDVFPGVADDVASDLAIRQVAAIWKDDIPITRTEQTLYPIVERLPGAEFTPTPLPPDLEDNTLIAPGDYEIPAHFYCTGHYLRNGSGYRYRLAKLEGKFSEALTQLYVRASQAGTSSSDVQVLSWSLQAGVAYEDLGSRERALVDRLIPEYRAQMELGFTQKVMRDWDTWSSRLPVPSFNEALAQMGDVGTYIRTLMDARQEIINKDYNYHALASVFVTESDAPVPMDPEKTPWSRIHDRIYMRFIAPHGAMNDGVIHIRILDGNSQHPQPSPTTAVPGARPNHLANACPLSDSLDCNQSAFDDVERLTRFRLAQVRLVDSPGSDDLTPTNIAELTRPDSTAISIRPAAAVGILPARAITLKSLIFNIVAVIAVASEAQSLTATLNYSSGRSKPVSEIPCKPHVLPRSTPKPLTVAQKVELAELLKSATGAIDLWTAAKHKGDPRAEILKANAVAAGYLVVSRAAEIVGLWERYTSRFSFDEISLEKSRPIGRVEIATKSALIGHGAFGSVEALVSVIVHEAGHLWQIDRYPLKSNWDFDRRRDFYESEATRIRDAYMRCLGFSEDVIRILRGYSHRILE